MKEVLNIQYIDDGQEQELRFGAVGGNLVLIKDEPQQSDNDQIEDNDQTEEKENAPIVPPQPVVAKDSMQIVLQSDTTFIAQANTLYSFEDVVDYLEVGLEKPEEENKVAEYIFVFTTSEKFKYKEFVTEDGKHVLYPTDFVLNNSTTYVLSVMYVGGCYIVNAIPYL